MNLRKLFTITVFFIFLSGSFLYADTITIAADPWMPFTGDGTEYNGLLLDIATEIFAEAGHTVEYVILPWSRAITSTRTGKYNAIAGCYQSEAPDFIFPDEEQGLGTNNLFVQNSSTWNYNGINSFKTVTLGIIQDYSYGEDLDAYIEENKRNSSLISIATGDNALETLIKQLNGGRIDVMIEDKLVAQFNIASLGYADNLKTIAVVSDPEQLWIGFSPANPKSGEYARILSEGMVKFRNDGRLKTILDKYGLSDWK